VLPEYGDHGEVEQLFMYNELALIVADLHGPDAHKSLRMIQVEDDSYDLAFGGI
jgi:hypothetical protein